MPTATVKNHVEHNTDADSQYMDVPINIIAIEDNPGDVALLRCTLAHEGTNVTVYSSLASALAAIKESHKRSNGFDIIITDLSLPDSDRHKTVMTLKRVAEDIPILVLTGHIDVDVVTQCISDGADGVIGKESWNGNLMAAVQAAKRRASERRLQDKKLIDEIHAIYAPLLSR